MVLHMTWVHSGCEVQCGEAIPCSCKLGSVVHGQVYQTATALHLMQPVACAVREEGMKKSGSYALPGHELGHVQLFMLCTARCYFLPGQAVLLAV